jgi:hypothetical protein
MMSGFFKDTIRSGCRFAFAELDNRACDLDYQTPTEWDYELYLGGLWPRASRVVGTASRVVTTRWAEPRRDTGGRSTYLISGTTRNSAGAVLANCQVEAFTTEDDTKRGVCASNSVGAFACPTDVIADHYVVAFKPTAAVAGVTRNDLSPS